jgi:uncharacterized protein (DUF58 family)
MRTAFLTRRPQAGAGVGPDRSPRPGATRQGAEKLASTLPPLLVAAERVAATVAQGVHGRRRVGRGEAFWQFRRYSPGDPVHMIDWRQSAKSDPLYIREKEWEAAESVWLWRDSSGSMRYRSDGGLPEKQERADLILLALAALLLRGGERVALLGSGLRPSSGRATLDRLVDRLVETMARAAHDAAPPAGGLPLFEPLPRHARLVLIGDFLAPLDGLAAEVRAFADRGVVCHLLQVLDPAEESLPFSGRVRFEGLEGEDPLVVGRAEALREAYIARMGAHLEGVKALARNVGGTFALHCTDRPPQTALLALYEALEASPAGYRREG